MFTLRPFVCSCLALLACVPVSAQTPQSSRPERPYRGIFASGVDAFGQSLTGSTTLSGGYDDNILADATQRSSPEQASRQGSLGQLSGSLNYELTGGRGQLNAGAGTSVRYYPSLGENDLFKTYNASVGGLLRVFTKPNLTVHQSASYQPVTFLSGFTGAGDDSALGPLVAPEPDFVPIASQYVSYQSGADLDVPITRRTSFRTAYNYRLTERSDRRTWQQSGSMGFNIHLTRDLSLRAMHRYTEGHYPGRIVRTHSPDIGLDFQRGLSLTRRASLTFGAGAEGSSVDDRTRYRASGNANLTYEIGRSWFANGSYRRGTYFIDTLEEPVFGDTAGASVNGLISRRVQFQAAANAVIGNAGFSVQRRFDAYSGTVSLSTALNRFMNVGMDYAYYKYIFDPEVVLAPGLPHNVNRQSIRAHVTFWAPLLNRTRRQDATR
jgi:hypothetical protein